MDAKSLVILHTSNKNWKMRVETIPLKIVLNPQIFRNKYKVLYTKNVKILLIKYKDSNKLR